METNIPGIYACGDCTEGLLQISKAVYQGTVAGLEAIKYLKNKN
jgi:thioredoxin reductase (NADPH)